MRFLSVSILLLTVLYSIVSAEPARRLDAPPEGTVVIEVGGCCCGSWSSPHDGEYEAAIAWADSGVASPLGGAFAQRFVFADTVRICSIDLDLTQIGGHDKQHCDLYLWSGSAGTPSTVVFVSSVVPGRIADWPAISRHSFTADACVTGAVWAGYWGNWPGTDEGWYLAADVGNDGGVAFTYVDPRVSDLSGWQPLSRIWGDIASVGISVEYRADSCAVTPLDEKTWGRIKALFAHP